MAGKKKTELELLDESIQAQKDRLTQLKNKKKVLLEAENIRLGKLVRKLFDGKMPDLPEEQEIFFENLVHMYDSVYHKPDMETQELSNDVSPSQMSKEG